MKACDFCSLIVSDSISRYDADRMVTVAVNEETGEFLDTLLDDDDGVWFACKECSALIDAEKWNELIERILTHLQQKDPVAWDEAVARHPHFRVFLQEVIESQYLVLRDSIKKRNQKTEEVTNGR